MFELPLRTGDEEYESPWRRGAWNGFFAGSFALVVAAWILMPFGLIAYFYPELETAALWVSLLSAYIVSILVFGWVMTRLTRDKALFRSSALFLPASLGPTTIIYLLEITNEEQLFGIIGLILFGGPFTVILSAFALSMPADKLKSKLLMNLYIGVGLLGMLFVANSWNTVAVVIDDIGTLFLPTSAPVSSNLVTWILGVIGFSTVVLWSYITLLILFISYAVGYEVAKERDRKNSESD